MKEHLHVFRRAHMSLAAAGIALALALGGCSGSNSASSGGGAQDAGAGAASGQSPANGRHMMAQVLATLGLSDAQKTQIRSIMKDARKNSAGADPATRRANYQAAMAKIDTVLTPDQRTKLHAKLAQLRSERQQSAPSQS
jgi:Spy/CpxP family protein refolding chaperone